MNRFIDLVVNRRVLVGRRALIGARRIRGARWACAAHCPARRGRNRPFGQVRRRARDAAFVTEGGAILAGRLAGLLATNAGVGRIAVGFLGHRSLIGLAKVDVFRDLRAHVLRARDGLKNRQYAMGVALLEFLDVGQLARIQTVGARLGGQKIAILVDDADIFGA